MALSRELSRRLRTDDEPLAKRLRLAENALERDDLPVTRKRDLVLKWLCEEAESRKNDTLIWRSLSHCLRSEKDGVALKSDVKLILKDALVSKLSESANGDLEDALACCETIFTGSETRRYFSGDATALAEILVALFGLVSRLEGTENVEQGRNCATRGIECFVACYKLAAEKEAWRDILVREILYPLCHLVDASRCDQLGAETHKCVQQVIFAKSRYARFKENGESDERAAELFQELKRKVETSEVENSVVVFLYVFRAALASWKNDPAAVDFVLRGLLEAAGTAKFKLLAIICQQLAGVSFDYENKVGQATLFEYLRQLVDEIKSSETMDAEHYQALETIAVLNPLVIEADVQTLLTNILLRKRHNSTQVAAYRNLMVALVQAGIRLRREQKLVSWILKAIEEELETECESELEIHAVLPTEFRKRFGQSVANMTSTQSIGVLRTLLFHLNNCVESCGKDKTVGTFVLEANVALMSAYFDGVRIFDNSVAISAQNKFVQCLKELGKTISSLADKILEIGASEKMIRPLLLVIWYWDVMHDWMTYYAPDAVTENLVFPIPEQRMREIVANVHSVASKNAMNKILVRKIKGNSEDAPDFGLLDDLENSWSIILDDNPRLVSSMNNSQIAELAGLLLNDARSSSSSGRRLSADCVQNDKRFVEALAYGALADVAARVCESTTKNVAARVNVVKILKRGNASRLIKEIKNDLASKEWKSLDAESLSVMEKSLQILLSLPLKYLSVDLRTVLLLVVYCVKNECGRHSMLLKLCRDIAMDASEKFDIDLIEVIDAESLMVELASDNSFQRVIESSLRNVNSWDSLKVFTKLCQTDRIAATMFLECLERIRPKLKSDQRRVFTKAESKLCQSLLDSFDGEVHESEDVGRLCVIVKASMASGRIPDNLVNVTESTLRRVFASEVKDEKVIAEGLQLVSVVLRHRGKLEFDDETLNSVWPHVLHNTSREVVVPLLERTEPRALSKVLALLHTKTMTELKEANSTGFANSLIVWDSLAAVQMGGARQKLRTTALHALFQALQVSEIPVSFWPPVLRLVRSALPESLHVVERSIDVAMLLAERSLSEAGVSACQDVLAVCSSLVKFNTSLVTDRLPVLLALYRKIVGLVARESRTVEHDLSGQQKLGALALEIEKFTNALVKLKKDLARMSPYVIADLVEIFSQGVIPARVKGPLEDSVGHFLSISDQHAVSLLSRTLPASTRAIFQRLYETYNKFYKYTGKI